MHCPSWFQNAFGICEEFLDLPHLVCGTQRPGSQPISGPTTVPASLGPACFFGVCVCIPFHHRGPLRCCIKHGGKASSDEPCARKLNRWSGSGWRHQCVPACTCYVCEHCSHLPLVEVLSLLQDGSGLQTCIRRLVFHVLELEPRPSIDFILSKSF